MSKVSVFNREWIELVFEGRNKEYGAYQLRKENPRTTMLALFCGIALVGLLVMIPLALNYFKPEPAPVTLSEFDATEIELTDIATLKKPEPPKPEPIQPEPSEPAPASSTATVAFRPLEVTNTPVEPLPVMDDFEDADPSSETREANPEGTVLTGTAPGTGSPDSTGTGNEPGTGNEAISSLLVDESPMFMGGMEDFYKKVAKEFTLPETNEAITLKVYVSFIVEKDGTMSNIKVLKDPGYGMGKEAIRVLKSIKTKWKPGKKAGKEVRTAYNLPITLNVK